DGRRVGRSVASTELRGRGRDAVADAIHGTIEVGGARLDDERFDGERRLETLRLKAALRVVGENHLLHERTISFANVDRRVSLIANDGSPRDVLRPEPN